jgi:hypothetical protein
MEEDRSDFRILTRMMSTGRYEIGGSIKMDLKEIANNVRN